MVKIGDSVIFVDELKQEHPALVTQVWGDHANTTNHPGLNVVFINSDPSMDDPYGRQIKRSTSIVHIEGQPAKANCWKEL